MDPVGTPILVLALSIGAHALLSFYKQPKEYHGELAAKVVGLEGRHTELNNDYIGFRERVVAELRHLTQAIERLTEVIEEKYPRSPSGEHRVLR